MRLIAEGWLKLARAHGRQRGNCEPGPACLSVLLVLVQLHWSPLPVCAFVIANASMWQMCCGMRSLARRGTNATAAAAAAGEPNAAAATTNQPHRTHSSTLQSASTRRIDWTRQRSTTRTTQWTARTYDWDCRLAAADGHSPFYFMTDCARPIATCHDSAPMRNSDTMKSPPPPDTTLTDPAVARCLRSRRIMIAARDQHVTQRLNRTLTRRRFDCRSCNPCLLVAAVSLALCCARVVTGESNDSVEPSITEPPSLAAMSEQLQMLNDAMDHGACHTAMRKTMAALST